jgi:hypothetical protein
MSGPRRPGASNCGRHPPAHPRQYPVAAYRGGNHPIAGAIMAEAALSFLGLGCRSPSPRSDPHPLGYDLIFAGIWWVTVLPGLTLVGVLGRGQRARRHPPRFPRPAPCPKLSGGGSPNPCGQARRSGPMTVGGPLRRGLDFGDSAMRYVGPSIGGVMTISSGSSPELIYSLRRVSESAALAAFDWIGRGDGMDGGRPRSTPCSRHSPRSTSTPSW